MLSEGNGRIDWLRRIDWLERSNVKAALLDGCRPPVVSAWEGAGAGRAGGRLRGYLSFPKWRGEGSVGLARAPEKAWGSALGAWGRMPTLQGASLRRAGAGQRNTLSSPTRSPDTSSLEAVITNALWSRDFSISVQIFLLESFKKVSTEVLGNGSGLGL